MPFWAYSRIGNKDIPKPSIEFVAASRLIVWPPVYLCRKAEESAHVALRRGFKDTCSAIIRVSRWGIHNPYLRFPRVGRRLIIARRRDIRGNWRRHRKHSWGPAVYSFIVNDQRCKPLNQRRLMWHPYDDWTFYFCHPQLGFACRCHSPEEIYQTHKAQQKWSATPLLPASF
jgi:hypothetical protein